jgi:hypothetical protein
MGVAISQEHGDFGTQARAVLQQPGQSSALLPHGATPAATPVSALRLIVPLEEMHDEYLKVTPQLPPVPFPQRL